MPTSEQQLPLLLFPRPSSTDREKRSPGRPIIHTPSAGRQLERLGPKFNTLQAAFDTQRVQLQATTPQDDPELVLVLETIGSISSFVGAVRRIEGLEWLLEADEIVEADEDFYIEGREETSLSGSLFLLGTNRQALLELVSLWNRYQSDPEAKFERGFGAWKAAFEHLRDIRFWSSQDRLGQDILEYWHDRLYAGEQMVKFEIEAWCFGSEEKNRQAADELTSLVAALSGRILKSALIANIGYHGFLVELPADAVRRLLSESPPELALSNRIMFFRPRGQAIAPNVDDGSYLPAVTPPTHRVSGAPVVALLDGLPLQNHPVLAGRLVVDDPDGWEPAYQAKDRVHGTAMASLIAVGELDGPMLPLGKPIYVRPIMRPDPADMRSPRQETTPTDVLLIDLVHRAVRRMFEGENGTPPVAPTIKVINLSVGDMQRPFDRTLSPWARLLDWLSFSYQVLFVVSAGNMPADLVLETPRESLSSLPPDQRQALALKALFADSVNRRIFSPAESINAITVGAVHGDAARSPSAPGRYDLFPDRNVSPYSCIGHGFRRAVKPEIVMPGGRVLYREKLVGASTNTEVSMVDTNAAPGHRVATPPNSYGDNTKYSRGTSNAAALATRGTAHAFDVVDALRAGAIHTLPGKFDAVLLKALLAHGANWGELEDRILSARPDISDRRRQQDFVARFVGYGLADVDRALTCTEQRATLIGVGELRDGDALEFRAPLPPCLNTQTAWRRLTITLAWLTPINVRSSKYRAARVWIDPPANDFGVSRVNCQWQHVQRGTLQHEILEGSDALAFVNGNEVIFKVNCAEDGGKIASSVPFALCVSLEVAEGVNLPIYQQIRDRVSVRVGVNASAA